MKMGGGKTHKIKNFLKRRERSLILTHRQTLAANIYHNVLDPLKSQWYLVSDLKHYSIDFTTQKSKATMGTLISPSASSSWSTSWKALPGILVLSSTKASSSSPRRPPAASATRRPSARCGES